MKAVKNGDSTRKIEVSKRKIDGVTYVVKAVFVGEALVEERLCELMCRRLEQEMSESNKIGNAA